MEILGGKILGGALALVLTVSLGLAYNDVPIESRIRLLTRLVEFGSRWEVVRDWNVATISVHSYLTLQVPHAR